MASVELQVVYYSMFVAVFVFGFVVGRRSKCGAKQPAA